MWWQVDVIAGGSSSCDPVVDIHMLLFAWVYIPMLCLHVPGFCLCLWLFMVGIMVMVMVQVRE